MTSRRAAAVILMLLGGCWSAKEPVVPFFSDAEWAAIRSLSGLPAAPPPDPTNAFADDPAAAALGKLYYFDTRFSGPLTNPDNALVPGGNGAVGQTARVSCARCHNPATGFTDQTSSPPNTSLGSSHTGRNAPTIYNAAYGPWFFWDGRKDSQWSQALGPTESPAEHNGNRVQFAMVIRDHYIAGAADHDEVFGPLPAFVNDLDNGAVFSPPFPTPPAAPDFPTQGRPGDSADPAYLFGTHASYDDSLSGPQKTAIDAIFSHFGKAIASYGRTIISRNSAFDQFVAGDPSAISDSAQRGLKLFIGKGRCTQCHTGPNFTDNAFHNIGVAQTGPNIPALDRGRIDGVPKVLADPFNGAGAFSDDAASGAAKLAGISPPPPSTLGAFKTPTLRSIAETAPYLHVGSRSTLRQVIVFYNSGGDGGAFVGTNELVALGLTAKEIDDLVAFLETLDGEDLPTSVTAPPTLPP